MARLTDEEQNDLVLAAQSGDMEAFQKLIKELSAYVKYIMRNVSVECGENDMIHPGISEDDVMQSGLIGIICAVKRYDPQKGVKFSTYAYNWISGEIKKEIGLQFNSLGLTNVDRFIASESLDDENSLLSDCLISDQISAIDKIIENEELAENNNCFAKAFSELTENEKKVLFMVYGVDCERTSNHKKIARELGISQIQVKKNINSAMSKLKKAMEEIDG